MTIANSVIPGTWYNGTGTSGSVLAQNRSAPLDQTGSGTEGTGQLKWWQQGLLDTLKNPPQVNVKHNTEGLQKAAKTVGIVAVVAVVIAVIVSIFRSN